MCPSVCVLSVCRSNRQTLRHTKSPARVPLFKATTVFKPLTSQSCQSCHVWSQKFQIACELVHRSLSFSRSTSAAVFFVSQLPCKAGTDTIPFSTNL